MTTLEAIASVSQSFQATPLPRFVGIYFLFREGKLLYIGSSTHLENRLTIHRSDRRWRHDCFDIVQWIPVEECDLLAYEGAFTRALNPPYSRRAPKDTGRDAEILARFGMTPDPKRRFERRINRLCKRQRDRDKRSKIIWARRRVSCRLYVAVSRLQGWEISDEYRREHRAAFL